MKEFIASFIDQKELSENSQSAYFYDLDQFVESIHGKVTPTNLRIYQASIKDFKPAVQKRKLSAVNQFLYYLYQERFISEYHRLVLPKIQPVKTHDRELLDLTHFWEESTNPQGRLMALLILEMGLLPSEILQVKVEDIQLDFHVIRVGKDGQKRVLKVPEPLLEELQLFLIEKGNQDLSAQSIREQYILKQRELGVDLFSIARELGLKTMVTLEKYK